MKDQPIRFNQSDPQQLPMSLDLEDRILGALLFDPACVMAGVIEQEFPVEAFYAGHSQIIFRTCCELFHRGVMPDFCIVATTLEQTDQLDEIGGRNRLIDLLEFSSSTVQIDHYLAKVLDDYHRRQAIRVMDTAIAEARDPNTLLNQTLEKAAQANHAITSTTQQSYTMASMAQVATEVMCELESPTVPGLSTGLNELDRMTGGFSQAYWVVAGRPSMGKTHVLLHLAHVAAQHGKPVLFISCEMNKRRIGQRLLARQTRIDSARIQRKQISESEWPAIGQAMQDLACLPLEIYDNPTPSEIDIRQKIRQIADSYGQSPIIIIDYLQKLWWNNNGRTRAEQLEKTSAALYKMSADHKTTVIVGAQINRGVGERSDKRPTMSDIKDSGSVEQDADLILTLYRDEYYDKASEDRLITEIGVAKNRDGQVGTIRVLHDLKFGHYMNCISKPLDF
jgi:replicative DNA helicase